MRRASHVPFTARTGPRRALRLRRVAPIVVDSGDDGRNCNGDPCCSCNDATRACVTETRDARKGSKEGRFSIFSPTGKVYKKNCLAIVTMHSRY